MEMSRVNWRRHDGVDMRAEESARITPPSEKPGKKAKDEDTVTKNMFQVN